MAEILGALNNWLTFDYCNFYGLCLYWSQLPCSSINLKCKYYQSIGLYGHKVILFSNLFKIFYIFGGNRGSWTGYEIYIVKGYSDLCCNKLFTWC